MSAAPKFTPGPWRPLAVGRHYIVVRDGGSRPLSANRRTSKFRTLQTAEIAATRAQIVEAYLHACRVAPDCLDGHATYYARELVRQCVYMREAAARAALAKAEGRL